MNCKVILPLPFLICAFLPFHANCQTPSAESLMKISTGTYTAFQAKDEKKMRALTTSDFIYVSSEGILSAAELGKATHDCILRNFALSSPKAKILSPTSAILTYTAHQDESCKGKPIPSILFNADVFIRRGERWIVSAHMETPATDARQE